MIIIGEKINATRKSIAAAIESRDQQHITQVAMEQVAAGADYLDVNGGDARKGAEVKNMAWLLEVVQSCTDVPVSIDSADADAVEVGLSTARGKPILNSVSLESARLEPLLGVLSRHECMVIALLMSDDGAPTGVDDRLDTAEKLIGKLTAAGKRLDEIILDPCFFPISANPGGGARAIEAIAQMRTRWPEVHIGGGLSNISYGLPKRRHVNMAAMCQAIAAGMDVGIVDPTTPGIVPLILASEAVSGRDEFCMNYITAERAGRLQ